MSSQAKRNRRNISSAKSVTAGRANVTETASGPKEITSSIPSYPYLINDLKWTGVVSALIIVILILCFVLFR